MEEKPMPTIEERLQALEREHEQLQTIKREHTELKKTIELQTIAIRALVSKEAFEKLQDTVEKIQEQNGKTFDALIAHDRLTNERLGDIQNQIIETDGKVAGLQTEMRQHFTETDGKVAGLQTEMRQHFTEIDGKVAGLQTEMRQRFSEQDGRIVELDGKVAGLQTTQTEHTTLLQQHTILLQQILARLPEK
jgi:hypothetical protein